MDHPIGHAAGTASGYRAEDFDASHCLASLDPNGMRGDTAHLLAIDMNSRAAAGEAVGAGARNIVNLPFFPVLTVKRLPAVLVAIT